MKRIKKIKDDIIYFVRDFFDQPRAYFSMWFRKLKGYFKDQRLFCAFVFVNLLNAYLLRVLTIGSKAIFSFSPLIADFAFLIIIGSFGMIINSKRRGSYYFIISFILMLICVINSSYYTFYTSFSSISLLSTTRFITAVGDAVVENVLQLKDVIYPVIFIIFIWWYFKTKKKFRLPKRSKKACRNTLAFGLICVFIFILGLRPVDISRITKQWNREYIVSKYGIYVYHVNDLFKSIEPKISSLFGYDEALKSFREYYEDKSSSSKNEYTDIFKDKNVIVIHGESIQNFVIGLEINGVEVAPCLTKLSQSGLYFDNFYSQVSVGTSSDAEFTFNTSLMPSNMGTAFGSYFNRTYVATPNLFRGLGYYTFSMHGNNADYWNRRTMYGALGYDAFYAKDDYDIDEVVGLGISDKSFFSQSVDKIEQISKEHDKYYGLLIMLSNHTPFTDASKKGDMDLSNHQMVYNSEKGEYEEVIYPYLEGTKLGTYLESVHYADEALGEFISLLDERGLLEDTVIVFYGDHDARLSIKEYSYMYNYDFETNTVLTKDDLGYVDFNEYQYELNRKVPFIIWTKDGKYQGVNSNVMGMYDVMPTLGNMFGFSNEYALGHDIFDIGEDNIVVFPTGNWLTNKVYYNAQKDEYFALKDVIITQEYIKEKSEYVDKLLNVSNAIIVYDLLGKEKDQLVDESNVIGVN